jgi:hypothetical protein
MDYDGMEHTVFEETHEPRVSAIYNVLKEQNPWHVHCFREKSSPFSSFSPRMSIKTEHPNWDGLRINMKQ